MACGGARVGGGVGAAGETQHAGCRARGGAAGRGNGHHAGRGGGGSLESPTVLLSLHSQSRERSQRGGRAHSKFARSLAGRSAPRNVARVYRRVRSLITHVSRRT